MKNTISHILKLGVAAGLIYWLIQQGLLDLSLFWSAPRPQWIPALLVILGASLFVANYRWLILLRSQDFQVKVSETMSLTLVGIFFNFTLPSSVGGDFVKAYYLAKGANQPKSKVLVSVIMDRIMGLLAMLSIAMISILGFMSAILRDPKLVSIATATTMIFLGLIVFVGIASSRRFSRWSVLQAFFEKIPLGSKFKEVFEAVNSYGKEKSVLVKAYFLSLVAQSLSLVFMYVTSYVIDVSVPVEAFLFAVPLGFIVMSLPVSPGGVGVGQVAFLGLFGLFLGYEIPAAAFIMTAFQVASLLYGLVGAAIFVRGHKLNLSEVSG